MKKEKAHAFGKGQKSGLLSAAGKIYQKLPVLPLLDRQTSAIAYFCILLYLGFVAATFVSIPSQELSVRLVEAPLAKNTILRLISGERYSYEISLQGQQAQSQQVGYEIKRDSSCLGLLVIENAPSSPSTPCLSNTGNLIGDAAMQNSTYGNQSILLFSPWMLAASENFSWSTDTVYSAMGVEMHNPASYQSAGTKEIAGRKAFEIVISAGGAAPGSAAKYYIDSEKRVLLFADLGNLTARLTSAPFALNWSNGTN